jgi:hypothetical protein
MKITVTTNHYLINFKYPVIARYQCYECPGAFYIDWKQVHWIKTGSTTKSHTASPLEEVFIAAEKARAKWSEAWLKRY